MSTKKYRNPLSILDPTNSTGLTTGSLVTIGGASITKNLSIGSTIRLYNAGNFTGLKAPVTPIGVTLTLPDILPVSSGSFLICDTSGNLTFSSATSGGAGTFTTITMSGQLTNTLSTGTSPFVVNSTTMVSNLNANFLGGNTFESPGAIGSTLANTGTFTGLTVTSTKIEYLLLKVSFEPAIGAPSIYSVLAFVVITPELTAAIVTVP